MRREQGLSAPSALIVLRAPIVPIARFSSPRAASADRAYQFAPCRQCQGS